MTLRVVKMPSLADELDRMEGLRSERNLADGEFEALPPDRNSRSRSGRLKFCGRCQRSVPVEEFNRHPRTADRLFPRCRDCQSLAAREARVHWLEHRVDGQEPA